MSTTVRSRVHEMPPHSSETNPTMTRIKPTIRFGLTDTPGEPTCNAYAYRSLLLRTSLYNEDTRP